jgi:uncharacterized protein (TIGR00106 family)
MKQQEITGQTLTKSVRPMASLSYQMNTFAPVYQTQYMHNYIINASIQIVPIVQDKHPYEWVDEAIAIIQQSGIKNDVGPFATVLEGTYAEVMQVINEVNEYLYNKGCNEWISNIQIQIRSHGDITADEKTEKFK